MNLIKENPKFSLVKIKHFSEVAWLLLAFQLLYFCENCFNTIVFSEKNNGFEHIQLGMHLLIATGFICLFYMLRKTETANSFNCTSMSCGIFAM